MSRSVRRWGLTVSLLAVTLAVAPVSQAISLCINCTCASACDLRCWNGFAVDTCSHWLCVDFCFPGPLSSETAAAAEVAPDTVEPPAECLEAPSVEVGARVAEVPARPGLR